MTDDDRDDVRCKCGHRSGDHHALCLMVDPVTLAPCSCPGFCLDRRGWPEETSL